MSEPNDTNPSLNTGNQPPDDTIRQEIKERVGDIIHKERVTRRVTLETIAKDLKLNLRYIKAIESNNLKELPADPYVRVYLRSIANYLMLDPDEILNKFFAEKGVSEEEIKGNRTAKIKINVEKDTEKRSNSWIIIVVVVAALAILSFVSKRMGWIAGSHSAKTPAADFIDTTDEESSVEPADTSDMEGDSLLHGDFRDVTEPQTPDQQTDAQPPKDSLRLVLNTTIDSVWVQIFCDGVSWKNFIHSGTPRSFAAQDSFNVHVGNNSLMRYTLNGKNLAIPGGAVKIFKISAAGVNHWNLKKWNTVFADRL